MEKAIVISLVIFFTATLSSSAPSPLAGACKHKDPQKPPANDAQLENSQCEYRSLDKQALIDAIMDACQIIIGSSSNIHDKLLGAKSLWATVGLYGGSIAPSGHMQISEVHYSLAASVSIFHTFLRPLGHALTEETVREVVRMERDTVSRQLSEVFSSLAAASESTYQLIKSDANIHRCIVPRLPANLNATLSPSHPEQDLIPRHKLIVDGIANELQALAISVRLLLYCMKKETGSCDF